MGEAKTIDDLVMSDALRGELVSYARFLLDWESDVRNFSNNGWIVPINEARGRVVYNIASVYSKQLRQGIRYNSGSHPVAHFLKGIVEEAAESLGYERKRVHAEWVRADRGSSLSHCREQLSGYVLPEGSTVGAIYWVKRDYLGFLSGTSENLSHK